MTKTIHTKTIFAVLASAALFVALALPSVVMAQEDTEEVITESNRGRSAKVEKKISDRKDAAADRIAEKREASETKSAEARLKACEKRKSKLESSMSKISTRAEKLVGTFDKVYERVQGFYESGQLTVSNYDELNDAVALAQENAATEAATLSELESEIDCEDPEVAAEVSTYRVSTDEAKAALKEYKTALVALISSMRSAAADKSDSDTQDDSDESETENEGESEEVENENEEETESENDTETDTTEETQEETN